MDVWGQVAIDGAKPEDAREHILSSGLEDGLVTPD